MESIQSLLHERAALIEEALSEVFSKQNIGTLRLCDGMKYSTLGGGKRIRGFLVTECALLFGGTLEASLPFACALEMIHAYSLIHDDLPCMDDDDYRRGKLTNHKVYGYANALLAGDALLTYAFEVLSRNSHVSTNSIALATQTLAKEAGCLGMCGGQYIDVNHEMTSFQDLKSMYLGKTGALIKASCLLGYFSATDSIDEDVVSKLSIYADNLGIAFQVVDDILDVTSTELELGKPIGSDMKNDKITSLSFMPLDNARHYVDELTHQAIEAISTFKGNENLITFANMLAHRKQ